MSYKQASRLPVNTGEQMKQLRQARSIYKRTRVLNFGFFALFLSLVVFGVLYDVELSEAYTADFMESIYHYIVLEVRLPRIMLAIMVGAALALSGAVMQALFQNPLASPDLLGNASAATLTTVTLFYWWQVGVTMLLVAGVLGSLVSFLIIYLLSLRYRHAVLILAGVALNALIAALISVVLANVENPWALSELFYWLKGSLRMANWSIIAHALPVIVIGFVLILLQGKFFRAFLFGEEVAMTMGIHLHLSRFVVLFAVSLLVGASIPFTGTISFVGLVAPHITQMLYRRPAFQVFIQTAIVGACMVLIADYCLLYLEPFKKLFLSAITAILGAPFLLYILLSKQYDHD